MFTGGVVALSQKRRWRSLRREEGIGGIGQMERIDAAEGALQSVNWAPH